jgi:hypothetical protein
MVAFEHQHLRPFIVGRQDGDRTTGPATDDEGRYRDVGIHFPGRQDRHFKITLDP